jgi:hypothetical protein
MKRKQLNTILINQLKRRNKIISFSASILIVFILLLCSLILHFEKNKAQYIKYEHEGNIDYQVTLDKSSYFEEGYLGENNEYISSLIDLISAKFEYKISLKDEKVKYKYSYRLEANVEVKEKNKTKPLYTKKEVLYTSPKFSTSKKSILIRESFNIKYDKYNDLIKNFLSLYDLENTESVLTLDMYIDVIGNCEEFENDAESKSTMSLIIPLTTKTTGIEISDNQVNSQNQVLKCKKDSLSNIIYLIYAIALSITEVILIIHFTKYIISSRTAEDIYEKELKKILNNYSSYIQILTNDIDLKKYQILNIQTFTDMLEIRDTINQPILMKENSEKKETYFTIPTENKLLYLYKLEVQEKKK